MKSMLLVLLKDSSKDVRGSVTSLINVVLWKGGLNSWLDLIPHLLNMLDSTDSQMSETGLTALFKICEDYLTNIQNSDEPFDSSIKSVLSKLINCVLSKHFAVRKTALKILNESLQDHYDSIKNDFDSTSYLNKLLEVAYDENPEIQKGACLGFVTFIENRDTVILPHMTNLIEYMLQKTQSEDSDIALQACEFWLACSKLPTCRNLLMPYICKLLPILLRNMRYPEYEMNGLQGSLGDDEHLLDKDEDIKPFNMSDHGVGDCPNDEDNNFDILDSVDEPYIGWTLRKCSAASVDALSVKFGDEILVTFIPLLNETLNHDDPLIKESGILALGAIADGCMNGLNPYLPEMINFLMKCMNHSHSIIRVITCWTLSRYMRFIVNEEPQENYFIPVMMVLLKHFLDGNKRVQRAALSAFCVFQEEANFKLVPYIDVILRAFVEGFKQYKSRSFFLLYDAIAVLSQSVGNNLNKPQFIECLMPPLMQKFNTIDDYYDDQFLALTECLSNVAAALEIGFLPFAEVVYSKCLIVINETVTASLNYAERPEYFDPPDKEPICGAHDLLLAMAFGLKTYFVKFVTNSNLVQQLYYTMQDEFPLIRQPALALFGEIIKLCYPFISDQIHDYIPVVIENLDKRFDGACNNAAWVIGKLCLAMGKNIEPYMGQIFEHFVEILQSCMGSKAMYQTVAISLCTLGLICPDEIAPHLATILKSCCTAVRNVRDCDEKEIGFRGLCELVVRNPPVLMNDFIFFCDAVASWNSLRPDLKEIIRNIILTVKHQCGDGWMPMYDHFPAILKIRLANLQCPPCLLGPLIKIVIEEIRKSCKKNPISCGYNTSAEVYEPLKLMQAVMAKTNEVCLRYMDNSMLCSLPTPGPPHYVVSVAAIKNTRRKMEDRHVVIHDLNTMFNIQEASPSSYYAIFDGHAGHDAAAYSAVHLHQFLAESKHFVNNPEQALIDAFYKTDAMFIDKEEKFCSGTTAVCALLKPKERMLYIAWVGDSQALIVSKGVLYQCVVPHKPGREDEKHRIEQQGGEVVHWGTWRVNGQLAVSRAIGDREYKPYVTAIPEVQEIRMTANTDFLILACDGLWDFLSEEEAATTVYNMVCTNSDDIDPISDRLVQLAKKQGSTDNISVIVVFLREPSKVAADAHWANRNTTTTMETGLDNANAANNPFANSNGAEILQQKDDFLLNQQKDEFLLNLSSGFKQNGGAIASPTTNNLHFADLDMNSANGKRQQIDEFDEDEDMGPETDVDAVDDIPSPLDVKQMMFHQESEENQKDNTFNPFTDIQEKGAFETDIDLELQKQQSEEFEQGSTREETPTPPADKVHDATVEENVADSGEESEDEWNYFKGNSAAADNSATLKTDQEVAELTKTIEEDEEQDMSQLNPNAAEFVPISSPTRNVSSPACRALVDDKVIAQSPRRATPAEIDINLPNPIEFESEVKNRPSEVFNNGHDSENGHKLSSQEVMENLLNGKNLDEIEFYPSTPSKIVNSNPEEFHFGPNATPFSTPAKMLDQSEALSTKALFGDESTASYLEGKTLEGTLLMGESSSPNETEEDPVTLPKLKEQDPMSMSFYQDENEHSIFDLNQVQELPENVDEFIGGDKNQEVNEKENANPEISNEFMLGVSQLPKTPEPDNLSESLEEKEDADVEKDMDVEKMQLVCDLPPAVSPSLEEVAKQPLPITPEPTELLEEDVKQPLPITPEPTELLEEDVKQPLPITPEPTEFLEEVAKQPLPITPEPTEHLEEVAKQPLPITPEPTEHVEDQNIDTKCEVNKQSDGTEETDLCKLTNSNLLASDFPETNEGINAMMSDAKKMSEMDSSPETEELSQISDAGDEVPPLCKSPEMTSDLDQFESDIKEVVQEACQAPQSQSSPTEGGVDEIVDNVTEAVEDLDPLKLCIKEEEQHSLPVHETDKKIDDMIESVEPTSDLDQVEPEIKEDLQEMCQIPKTEHLLPDNELVDVLYDAKSTEMISDLDQVEPVVEMKKVDDVVEMITEAMVENVEISPELKDLNVEETSQMEEHAELPIHQKGDEITESKTEIPIDSAISETVEMMDKVEKDGEVLAAKDDILDITQDSGEILETKLEQPIETPQYESLDTLEKAEKEIEIKEQEIEIKEKEIEIKEEEKPEVEVCDEFKSKFEDHGVELLEEPAESQPSLTPEPSNDVSIREEEIDIDNGGDIKSDDKVSDDLRDLDSPMEDVTTSIKDDVSSSEIIEEAKDISTEKEIIIQDSFSNEPVLETSQPNITEELMEASQSAVVEKSPEVIPEPVKEEVEDSREFLERSTVPEMLSPLSPATQPPIDDDNNILDVTDKEVDISSSKVDENIVQEATTDLIKTDTIAPQYPEETTVVATPSEEIKTLVAPEKQEEPTLPDVSKVDDSDKKVSDAAVIGTTAAVAATAAAVAAGVTAAAKPKEKKSLDKKPAAKKPAPSKSPQTSTKPTPAKLLTKPTASKTLAHPPAKSPATTVKATTKTVASKTPSPSTRTPTKTSSAKPAPKLDSTIPVKAAEKKTSTMTNGEVKGPTKPTTMLKKTSLGTKATPPKTTPSKISPTKADAPKAAPKSAPKQPLAATKTSLSSAKPRPNSLASTGAGGATKTATTLKSTVTKTTTLTSPKPMGAPPKPRPTSAPLARPKPAGTSTKPKAPDTEKQIKETVNKQLTTTRTSIAAKTSTTSSRVTASTTATKKAETKAPTTTRTTTTKTTTIKATKKPAEITRLTGKAKPITTKTATKPQENGTTEQLTTVMQETTAILTTDPQLVKDLSPIENKFIIDNSQVTENNVAD